MQSLLCVHFFMLTVLSLSVDQPHVLLNYHRNYTFRYLPTYWWLVSCWPHSGPDLEHLLHYWIITEGNTFLLYTCCQYIFCSCSNLWTMHANFAAKLKANWWKFLILELLMCISRCWDCLRYIMVTMSMVSMFSFSHHTYVIKWLHGYSRYMNLQESLFIMCRKVYLSLRNNICGLK